MWNRYTVEMCVQSTMYIATLSGIMFEVGACMLFTLHLDPLCVY